MTSVDDMISAMPDKPVSGVFAFTRSVKKSDADSTGIVTASTLSSELVFKDFCHILVELCKGYASKDGDASVLDRITLSSMPMSIVVKEPGFDKACYDMTKIQKRQTERKLISRKEELRSYFDNALDIASDILPVLTKPS